MGPHSIFWNIKKCGWPYEENGCMAPKLSGGPILVKIPNIYCAIYDLTSNEVLMTQKVRKTKFFQWKNGCMTPQLLGGPIIIQIYNIEPFLAWAIKTIKVNTVQYKHACNHFGSISNLQILMVFYFQRSSLYLFHFSGSIYMNVRDLRSSPENIVKFSKVYQIRCFF